MMPAVTKQLVFLLASFAAATPLGGPGHYAGNQDALLPRRLALGRSATTSAPQALYLSASNLSLTSQTSSTVSPSSSQSSNATLTSSTRTTSSSNSTIILPTSFHSTHTPTGCQPSSASNVVYVTETTVVTDTITASAHFTYSHRGPDLIAPTPFCFPTPMVSVSGYGGCHGCAPGLTTSVSFFVPQPSQIPQTSTVKYTIKTTEIVSAPTAPAITFGVSGGPSLIQIPHFDPQPSPSLSGPVPVLQSSGPALSPLATSQPDLSSPPEPGQSAVVSPGPSSDSSVNGVNPQIAKVNNVPISVGTGGVVLGSTTYAPGGSGSTVQVVSGQTFTILPSSAGVVAPGGMTLTPAAAAASAVATINGQSFTANGGTPSGVVVAGSDIPIPTSGSTVITIGGSAYTINPSQIVADGSTVALPTTSNPDIPEYTAETVDGVAFDLGSSQVVIEGRTESIGPGATTTTMVVNGETLTIGPFGVAFPTTTVAPLSASSTAEIAFTTDGATFDLGPSSVIIDGTTYALASPTDVVIGSATVSIGTFGIDLPSTTIAPPVATPTSSGRLSAYTFFSIRPFMWILVYSSFLILAW